MTTAIETTDTALIGIEAALAACKGDVVITNGYDTNVVDFVVDINDEDDTTEYILQSGIIDGQPCEYVRAIDEHGYIVNRGADDIAVMDADDYAKTGRGA